MRDRARAMLKIDALMQALEDDDRRVVAFEVYRTYFGPEGVHKESTGPPKVSTRSPQTGGVEDTQRQGETPRLHQYVVPIEASSSSNGTKKLGQEAKEILYFLNEKTGKSYRAVETNLLFIKSCLKTCATLAECRGVIARKVRQWKGTEFEKYLRPATLFNRTKFEQYLGEKDAGPAS